MELRSTFTQPAFLTHVLVANTHEMNARGFIIRVQLRPRALPPRPAHLARLTAAAQPLLALRGAVLSRRPRRHLIVLFEAVAVALHAA